MVLQQILYIYTQIGPQCQYANSSLNYEKEHNKTHLEFIKNMLWSTLRFMLFQCSIGFKNIKQTKGQVVLRDSLAFLYRGADRHGWHRQHRHDHPIRSSPFRIQTYKLTQKISISHVYICRQWLQHTHNSTFFIANLFENFQDAFRRHFHTSRLNNSTILVFFSPEMRSDFEGGGAVDWLSLATSFMVVRFTTTTGLTTVFETFLGWQGTYGFAFANVVDDFEFFGGGFELLCAWKAEIRVVALHEIGWLDKCFSFCVGR